MKTDRTIRREREQRNGRNAFAKNEPPQTYNKPSQTKKTKENIEAKTAGKTELKCTVKKKEETGKKIVTGEQAEKKRRVCPYEKKCGGCQYVHLPYKKQLERKQQREKALLGSFGKVQPIIGMKDPFHYRNKVHGVVVTDRKGNGYTGIYEEKSHRIVRVDSCLIENEKADAIMQSVAGLMKSFKMRAYNEDTGYGFLRHILIRTGYHTGQIMVVLVTASPVFPSKNNFVKALRKLHPEITTIVANVNDRNTSMILGDKQQVLYGKGYIEDIL